MSEHFVPTASVSLNESIEFRALLQGGPGQEKIDCRLWYRDPLSGSWSPGEDVVLINCDRLITLQSARDNILKTAKEHFDQAMAQAESLTNETSKEFNLIGDIIYKVADELIRHRIF